MATRSHQARTATRLQLTHAVLRRRAGSELRLAVVADTHSQPHPEADRLLRELAPDAILHAGDIGDLEVLRRLERVAPLYAVRGNIDGRGLPDVLVLDVRAPGDDEPDADADADADAALRARPLGPGELRLLLIHIAVAGPRLRAEVARLAAAHGASLVVCGHSHVPFIGRDRGITVFNPGSIGPRRFQLPIVFGTIALAADRVRLTHVDCETGLPWSPP